METKNTISKHKSLKILKVELAPNKHFSWIIPLFKKGLKKELTEADIYQTLKRHEADKLVKRLEKAWNDQKYQNVKPSLWKAIWTIFKWDIIFSMCLYFFIEFILKMSQPLALGKLMGYYSPNSKTSQTDAFIYASVIVIAIFINVVVSHYFILHYLQIALKVRVALFMSKKSAFYRLKIALKTDERIRNMNEIISGIQVIKIYTWEQPLIKLIDFIRRSEIKLIKIANYLDALTTSFSFFINRTAIFLCILTYVLTGNNPNAQYVFVVSSFYGMLMSSASLYLPMAVARSLQANVSIKRFENFLQLEEVENKTVVANQVGLRIAEATAKWSETSMENTLSNIKLEINPSQVVAIIGPIGSGKSSLLQLCLNELPLISGSVEIGGRISYANQEPWLFGGTIRQNILLGQSMDTDKYKEVIRVCALEEDIAQFPYGDNTIVGERGILLSGGQKARINLARAVYKEADIYLLDDPLSAVDASVGKQLFNNCINGYLKDKCTILVTHQVQYLTSVDKIYLMSNGAIAASGSYSDLQASGEDFTKLLKDTEKHEQPEENNEIERTINTKDEKEQNEEKETRSSGQLSSKVYTTYIRACGTWFSY
ncbi:hypothetical protein GEV33_002018 [Tenebrio molitor]|uniref:Uncharacterized protein n=1 Tax=Tenebrio molitor TaxID=7067 RepID=A0A8J6HWD9_TENMO|nr:hypothetical protein GEV33_002018 [Tenebrio molitor]